MERSAEHNSSCQKLSFKAGKLCVFSSAVAPQSPRTRLPHPPPPPLPPPLLPLACSHPFFFPSPCRQSPPCFSSICYSLSSSPPPAYSSHPSLTDVEVWKLFIYTSSAAQIAPLLFSRNRRRCCQRSLAEIKKEKEGLKKRRGIKGPKQFFSLALSFCFFSCSYNLFRALFLAGFSVDLQVPNQQRQRKMEMAPFLLNRRDCCFVLLVFTAFFCLRAHVQACTSVPHLCLNHQPSL